MADIKISELTQAESLSLSDLMESAIPYNGGFQSRRMSLAQLSNYLENSVLHTALSTTAKTIIGAINEIVLDLANYYTTSQTYSKTEVDTLIAGVSGLHFEVVNALPTQDIDMNTIYLVPKQDSGQQDVYDEFICLDDTTTPATWEKIGTTEIDLSDYVTDTELATILNDYVTTSGLSTILANYATTSAMTTALADKVDKVQGKGLSTEDYTTVEKAKLNGIESGAQVNDHKVAFENVSSNPPTRAVILIKDADDISGNSYPQFDAGSLFYYPTISEWRLGNIHFRGEEELDTGGTGEFMKVDCRNSGRSKFYNLLVDMNLSDNNDVDVKLPSSSGQLALSEETVKWSEQNVLGAKNLLPYNPYNPNGYVQNGITFTVTEEGYVIANGTKTTASNNATFNISERYENSGLFLPNGTYKLTGCPSGGSVTTYQIGVAYYNNAGTYTSLGFDEGEGVEFTIDGSQYSDKGAWVRVFVTLRGGYATANNLTFKPMIRLASISDSTYQAPSNTNRQLTLNKLSWEENKASGVKNYINYPYNHPMQGETYSIRAVAYTDNGDGGIVANGTCDNTGNSYCQVLKTTGTSAGLHFCKLPKGRYHFSGGISEDYYMNLSRGLISNPSADRTTIGTDYGDGFDFDVTEQQANESYFCSFCFVAKNKTATNVVFYPSITRYEDTSDGYAMYAMTNAELTQIKADMDNIAPTETSGTAINSYAVGDYMWWRHGFYRVTQAIAVGDSITTSKVTKTTLGAELKRALT